MNEPINNKFNIVICLIIFAFGIFVGVIGRDTIAKKSKQQNKSAYIERHEGQQNFINPLIACDVAADMVPDPGVAPFKEKIELFLNTRLDKHLSATVSVYYREMNEGYWFSIGDSEKFIPASMRKVPLMIALLKQAEMDANFLEHRVTFDLSNDYNLNQNVKPALKLVIGTTYTIRDLIYRMIVYSDNNAFTLLTRIVDSALLDNVYYNLRLLNPRAISDDDYLSVQTYESFFRALYNASYLSKKSSAWALEILSKSDFRSGIVAGVPAGVKVAHKFGEKSDAAEGTVQLHDCGIVYLPNHPYLLCVMSKGPNFELLDDVIAEISRITFTEVSQQHKNH